MPILTFITEYGRPICIATTSMAVAAVAINPRLPYMFKELVLSIGTVSGFDSLPIPTEATEPCRKGSINCIRTTWTPKESMESGEAIRQVRECLSKYPQEGQGGVDKGGWKVVDDRLDQGGSARVEFRSGIGPISKFLNSGRPFVDDLLLQVESDGAVQVRSSSRKGMADEQVNKKRVMYLAECMPTAWETSEPDYNNF